MCHEAEDIEEMDEDEENEVGLFTDNAISALLKITYY